MQAIIWSKIGGIVALVLIVGVLAACGSGTTNEPTTSGSTLDGEALVNDRCTQCHGIDKVTQAKKGQEQWQSTVAGMVAKGAKLSAEEQDVVVAYLAEKYGS